MEVHGGRGGIAPTHSPRFTPGERTPGTHCIGGWVGPRAGLDAGAGRRILDSNNNNKNNNNNKDHGKKKGCMDNFHVA
jgi:hypothetical protein